MYVCLIECMYACVYECIYVCVCMHVQSWTLDLSLLRNWQFHSIAVALVLLVRLTNKLAKVLEHVFRSKKYKNSFWKFGQEDPQLSA